MRTYVLRLNPNQDLKEEISELVDRRQLQAGIMLCGVGSLDKVVVRLAGAKKVRTFTKDSFEIVSLIETLSPAGLHLHLAIADKNGQVFGGHLQEGCLAHTTVELVVGELESYSFERKKDAATGFKELSVKHRP